METKGWKSFWTALWVSLLVLLPLVAGTAVLAQRQAAGRVRASESQSGVPVQLPREEKPPDPAGLRGRGRPGLCPALPERRPELHPSAGGAGPAGRPLQRWQGFSADCYAAAGPARCLQGLRAVLDLPEDAHYLAATPETLAGLCDGYGSLRVGFSGALSPDYTYIYSGRRRGLGRRFGPRLFWRSWPPACPLPPQPRHGPPCGTPFFRQNLDALPASLPDALRSASDSLLTDLTAADLLTLEDTLELLANGQLYVYLLTAGERPAAVTSGVLPAAGTAPAGFTRWTKKQTPPCRLSSTYRTAPPPAGRRARRPARVPQHQRSRRQADGPSM